MKTKNNPIVVTTLATMAGISFVCGIMLLSSEVGL